MVRRLGFVHSTYPHLCLAHAAANEQPGHKSDVIMVPPIGPSSRRKFHTSGELRPG
jgi:hypothetical protein